MGKVVITVALVIAALLVPAALSWAANEIINAYSADQNGTQKVSFGWNETPYLFSAFNYTSPVPQTRQTWTSPSGLSFDATITDNSYRDLNKGGQVILNTLFKWEEKRELGNWTWSDKAYNGAPGSRILNGTFSIVTPEPLGLSLFLLGSGVFAMRRFRRAK